jgi:hypothetical protein
MFPIDLATKGFNMDMCDLLITYKTEKLKWRLRDILPKVLCAGEHGGELTDEGALLLDPSGTLKAVPL